jgi:hypothetical protein
MRQHKWIPVAADFTEWECEHCGHQIDNVGPPCKNFVVIYKIPETGEELEISCEEIEDGVANAVFVHDV